MSSFVLRDWDVAAKDRKDPRSASSRIEGKESRKLDDSQFLQLLLVFEQGIDRVVCFVIRGMEAFLLLFF